MAQINEPDFWDRIDHREVVLDRYRALDVAIRMRKRFAGPILHLVELLDDNPTSPSILSPALEQAADSFRQWEECLAEEGHAAIWMVLSNSDPLKSAGRWIRKLANMELAWSRRLGLTGSVNESVLSRLLPDLARAWSKQPADVDVARIYGKDGVIQDPRTGVASNRIKEIWKGRLDEFLEGWRRIRG